MRRRAAHFIPLAGLWMELANGPDGAPGDFGLCRLGADGQVAQNVLNGVTPLGGPRDRLRTVLSDPLRGLRISS